MSRQFDFERLVELCRRAHGDEIAQTVSAESLEPPTIQQTVPVETLRPSLISAAPSLIGEGDDGSRE